METYSYVTSPKCQGCIHLMTVKCYDDKKRAIFVHECVDLSKSIHEQQSCVGYKSLEDWANERNLGEQ